MNRFDRTGRVGKWRGQRTRIRDCGRRNRFGRSFRLLPGPEPDARPDQHRRDACANSSSHGSILRSTAARQARPKRVEAAKVTSVDVVYDLGSGDGRIPIAAARLYGARAVGIELDPALVREAAGRAREAGVSDKVRFVTDDLFTTDISAATVVSLYLTPFLNFKLLPKLNRELKPGTRVVSHQWEMMDPSDRYEYHPDQKLIVGNSLIYVWTIPIVRR